MPEKTPKKIRIWFKALRILLVVYVSVAVFMVFFENRLVYFPTKYPNGNWNPKLEFEDAHFQASDGTQLHGWFLRHAKPNFHFLYCHGNADFVANLGGLANSWRQLYNANVLVFDYRGYGRSEGKPNEKGLIQDARAARTWLAKQAQVSESEIILVGRSLGGGVACAIAAEGPAKALILQSTFPSLPDVAASHYPWLPVHVLMRNRFDSQKHIQNYGGPVLQSHGTADQVIPFHLGKQLFDSLPGKKQFFTCEGADHNSFEPPEYFMAVGKFLNSLP